MAKFEKGHKFSKGRPKGTPNRSTVLHKEILSAFLEEEASPEKLKVLYNSLEPKDKAQFLPKIYPFVVPKMQQIDIEQAEITPEFARGILNALLTERNGTN